MAKGCDWFLSVVAIIPAWYLHQSCHENNVLKDSSWTQLCCFLCLVKTIGSVVVRLIECCYMNENPQARDCGTFSDIWTIALTELPLLVLCAILISNKPMCQDHTAHIDFVDVLRAFHINGWMSLLHSAYLCIKSFKGNWCVAISNLILAGFVILRSNCIL
jgi:hypothetical protein